MAASQSPWEVLEYTCHTCGATAPWAGRLLEHHLNHQTIRIACLGCKRSFTDKASAQHHFDSHQFPELTADTVPPAPHNTPERALVAQTPTPSSLGRNVLTPTLSPVAKSTPSQHSLQPAQRPRAPSPASSSDTTAASEDVAELLSRLRRATSHLTWMAAVVSRLPDCSPTPSLREFAQELNTAFSLQPNEEDVAFRRELHETFPHTLGNTQTLSVAEMARLLLPVYEFWKFEVHK